MSATEDRPPFSDLASPESAAHSKAKAEVWARIRDRLRGFDPDDIVSSRSIIDELYLKPGLAHLRETFAVSIESTVLGGVPVDFVEPAPGSGPVDEGRILINVHGGGFAVGAGAGGKQESVPIAALARIRVVTVDYRMAPEHTFPAASEDIAAVYRALLEARAPEQIGIYGCSAGGYLTAAAIPWFEAVGLPRPGAVGVFGMGGGMSEGWGDSLTSNAFLKGEEPVPGGAPGPYFAGADPDDPRVSPIRHADVLNRFPPTLLLSGTRDMAMSRVLSLHARLIAAGVDARLHIWEGAEHCSFAQGIVDPGAPETRQAWDVIVRFFQRNLAVPVIS